MNISEKRATVVGVGCVGLATALGRAEQDWAVVLFESDAGRLGAPTQRQIPSLEPELPEVDSCPHAGSRVELSRTSVVRVASSACFEIAE